ncbi:MAG: FAD-binding oxidoreductase [Solirubrobacterales bacterium]|nr:FAD-binding oxidoreductase [Solirubrobacterales bacterium]
MPGWVAGGTPPGLRRALADAVGADQVLDRAIDLVKYASDASPYRLIPRAVVTPRGLGDIVRLMTVARDNAAPLVFRAGGTSLNGQAQSDSVLVDIRRHWNRARVLDGGARVWVQPGIVLGHVNRLLARTGRRLGPDPASTDIACVGGVIANNSGGMRCGIVADSYRTVRSLKIVLANGTVLDTADADAERQFAAAAPELAAGLAQIRDELRADAELAARVRKKFEIKNTTGYRLCAFLDADTPLEIFRRLVIGSEGTLAFVAEAVFETVPLGRHATLALVSFDDLDAAAAAVGPLVAAGASATELMLGTTLIAAAYNMPGTPERWKTLPPSSAALLVEFRNEVPEALDAPEHEALEILEGRALLEPPRFSRQREEMEMLWHVREGMAGLMAAVRPPGVQLIFEDVCVPPPRVAEAAKDLQALLSRHGFIPGLAGHASAGNFHFVLTPNFWDPGDRERYDAFVHELATLIVDKYDGSLKAEHGTGINMAPFVEREWGAKATEMMWRIKALADPHGILAPGVVLNRDPTVHLRNLKSTPDIEDVATKCIECGFCEPVCPSRNVTTTPRQRIVIRREMARQTPGSPVLEALREQYGYEAVDTCAADGSCMHACPVAIDTGKLIKALRHDAHGMRAEQVGATLAARYDVAERATRGALRAGGGAARLLRPSVPPAAPAQLPFTVREGAAAVYMPACINRMFGNPAGVPAHPTLPEALVALSRRAGRPLWIPDDVAGHCCGVPWSSKGFDRGHARMAQRTAAAIEHWTGGGTLPLVLDASSCSHGLIHEVAPPNVEILDSIAWVHDHLLARLQVRRKQHRAVIHSTCSAAHLGLAPKLVAIAAALADEVEAPAASGCCGMAGDRGWLHPELPASALRDVAQELEGRSFDVCVSSNRTCEAALQQVTARPYESHVLALERATRG